MSIIESEAEILAALETLSEAEKKAQVEEIEERINQRYQRKASSLKGKGNKKEQNRRYRFRQKLKAQGLLESGEGFDKFLDLTEEQDAAIKELDTILAEEKKIAEMEWRCKPKKPVRVLAIKIKQKE